MAINPQINDMAWFGKPADPVDSFQKGMNLAEQSQRMKQSADMHPLKMADLQSATAARDANTNLSKQSYDFNELTKTDRASSVNALARQQQSAANISEDTEVARTNMVNLAALAKQRDWDVRQLTDKNLEVQAAESQLSRLITDNWKNDQLKHDAIKRYKHETNMIEQNAIARQLGNDFTRATQQGNIAFENARLLDGYNTAQRNLSRHNEHMDSMPQYVKHKERVEELVRNGELDKVADYVFDGVTPELQKDLQNYAKGLMANESGVKAAGAAAARVKSVVDAQGRLGDISDAQMGALKNSGLIVNGTLTDEGADMVNRMTEMNQLLEAADPDGSLRRDMIIQATGATSQDAVKMFDSGINKPIGGRNSDDLSGTLAGTYGTRVGSQYVLNDEGLRRLRQVAVDMQRQRAAATLSKLKGEGQVVVGYEVDSKGNISYKTERGYFTPKELSKAITDEMAVIRKENLATDEPVPDKDIPKVARDRVLGGAMIAVRNSKEAAMLGVSEGDVIYDINQGKPRMAVRDFNTAAAPPSGESDERGLIVNALKESGGNQPKAARLLGTTPAILRDRIKELGIKQQGPSPAPEPPEGGFPKVPPRPAGVNYPDSEPNMPKPLPVRRGADVMAPAVPKPVNPNVAPTPTGPAIDWMPKTPAPLGPAPTLQNPQDLQRIRDGGGKLTKEEQRLVNLYEASLRKLGIDPKPSPTLPPLQ